MERGSAVVVREKTFNQVLELLVALHKVVFPEEVAAKVKVAAT
jgi:hypothetical protein